jgi:SAM-dependent methyltransferase
MSDRQRLAWERFAAEDPLFFIEADPGKRASLQDFLETGRRTADWALDWIGERAGRGRLVEIGCGLGRTSRAFAASFEQVDGVDVSETMISRARELDPPPNLRLIVGSGRDLAELDDGAYDVVFSHLVFQHLPDEELVAGYLREVRRVLAAGGVALIQLDTRPRRLAATIVQLLPDHLLPRIRRRHVRRYRRDPQRVRELAGRARLEVADERGAGTAEHWLLLTAAA